MKIKSFIVVYILVFIITLWLSAPVPAQTVPTTINYQGRLTDNTPSQLPVNDESVAMVFSIYDSLTGGNLLWTETWPCVSVVDGIFNVLLGSYDTPIPATIFSGGTNRYLEIEVESEILTPRQTIGSVGFAYQSQNADDSNALGGHDATSWQRTLSGPCPEGEFLYGFNQDGTPQCEAVTAVSDHGALTGLGDDDHPQYFYLSQNETVTGIPAFNGGTSGATAPFLVDSTTMVTNLNADLLDGQHASVFATTESVWLLTGNAGTTAGTNSLGTTDNQALEFKVNNYRALRLEPNSSSPNVIGGYSGNYSMAGVFGAVICGGGQSGSLNRVVDHYGFVGGGYNNQAGFEDANVSNATFAAVSGGLNNIASSTQTFIGGGNSNTASGSVATISGGQANTASGNRSTIGGGQQNTASGEYATVPGGYLNVAGGTSSFAAGRRAKATLNGCFVWGDSTDADVTATTTNQFLVRSTGGVSFNTGSNAFQINGNTAWHAGNDGTSSGLDADLLDGQHASYFAVASHNHDATYVNEGQENSITSAMITNGTISFSDIGQNGCSSGQVMQWNGSAWIGATISGVTDHGALTGLGDDDHPQYFNLGQSETVSGIPAFNGGTSGVSAPFTVDSTYGVTNLNADLLDGFHASAFQQQYDNVIIVAKSGALYTSIQTALNSITDANSVNRYLVKVMPGLYGEQVTMKQYVDIEGAGELTTRIVSAGSTTELTGTVVGADNSELRFLKVENTGGSTYGTAIFNNATSPRITHVTAETSGNTYNFGIRNESSSAILTNMTVRTMGGNEATSVRNTSSTTVMTNVIVTAFGASNYNRGVYNYGNETSPEMIQVTMNVSGGNHCIGVDNFNSDPIMTGLNITASGGTTNTLGVYNYSSSPVLKNVTVAASGGTNCCAVRNDDSLPIINNSTLSATDGTNNYGIYNVNNGGSYLVLINHSQIRGATNTIYNALGITVRVGATLLDGGNVTPNGGTCTCAGVYDETYHFFASTCP